MAEILTVVPARGGSKTVPGKNLKLLAGTPLIAHVLRMLARCRTPMRVVVSTDSEAIAAVARAEGCEVPFARPPGLAGDDISATAPIRHAMEWMDRHGFHADIVVAVMPTAPLMEAATVDEAIGRLRADERLDSAVAVRRIEHNHPFRAYRLAADGALSFLTEYTSERILQKQDRPAAFAFTGGLYVRRRRLLETWDGADFALGERRTGVVVPPERAVDIDHELDFVIAEAVLARLGGKGAAA